MTKQHQSIKLFSVRTGMRAGQEPRQCDHELNVCQQDCYDQAPPDLIGGRLVCIDKCRDDWWKCRSRPV